MAHEGPGLISIPVKPPASSSEMLKVIRSVLDAAVDEEIIFFAVEYKYADGRINRYSVSQSAK